MFGLNDDQTASFVYLSVLLVLLVGSIGLGRRHRAGYFRHLGIWVLIAAALVVVYVYREPVIELARPVIAELTPSRAMQVTTREGGQALVIRRSNDGHFHVDATVNGASVRFLVDTGATNTTLSTKDAARAGIDVAGLSFNRTVRTANGTALYARAEIDSLEIGPYRLADVAVGIMPADALDTSLLGMSTIDRFAGWRVEGDRMILTP